MDTLMDDEFKWWKARRKSALVLEIIQGKTTSVEASQAHYLLSADEKTAVQERFAERIKKMLGEASPLVIGRSYTFWTSTTVQHIFQLKGCQIRKRPVGFGRAPR